MRRLLVPTLLALVLAACSPSNGSEKGGKGPGGFPAAEVNGFTVAPASLPVTFEYVGPTAGPRERQRRAPAAGILKPRNFVEGLGGAQPQSTFPTTSRRAWRRTWRRSASPCRPTAASR